MFMSDIISGKRQLILVVFQLFLFTFSLNVRKDTQPGLGRVHQRALEEKWTSCWWADLLLIIVFCNVKDTINVISHLFCLGVPMVVACLSTQGQLEPIYVCFACEDCFPESSLKLHFESTKHLIDTLVSFCSS